jgi:branched-chain amino acid aminotransferase
MSEQINIKIEKAAKSKINETDFANLDFGKYYSDHMFVVDFEDGEWQEPSIIPYGNISLSPATSAIHYGQTVFEGFKAHRTANDEILIFRPDANWARLNKSLSRLCMPEVPKDLFLDGVKKLTELEKEWVPREKDAALYFRPIMFATDPFIRVKPASTYKLIIFCSPVGAYYGGSVKVKVERNYVRSSEGGVGFSKTAGNYAASLLPAKLALEQGYQQILWTDAKEHKFIEESGTMNVMFIIGETLVTPALSSSILEGVTRDSILKLAKSWGIKVEERKISSDELISYSKNNTLKEAFGTGTAATVSIISTIHCDGIDYVLPAPSESSFSAKVAKELNDIKYGVKEDTHGWIVKV